MATNSLDKERGYYRGLSIEELRRVMAITRNHPPRSKERREALQSAAIEYRKTYSGLQNIIDVLSNFDKESEQQRGAFNRLSRADLAYILDKKPEPEITVAVQASEPASEPTPEPTENLTVALLTKVVELQREQMKELERHTELLAELAQKWS